MKLSHYKLDSILDIKAGLVNTYIVENAKFFTDMIKDIINSSNGNPSDFIFSNNGNILELKEKLSVMIDYTNVDFANKKILNALTKSLNSAIKKDSYNFQLAYHKLYELFLSKTLDYNNNITINEEMDISSLVKLFSPKLNCEHDSILQTIIEYVNALISFCNLDVLVLVSVKDYLSEEEYKQLVVELTLRDVAIINIQSHANYKTDNEKIYIIDKDLCEIFD